MELKFPLRYNLVNDNAWLNHHFGHATSFYFADHKLTFNGVIKMKNYIMIQLLMSRGIVGCKFNNCNLRNGWVAIFIFLSVIFSDYQDRSFTHE